MRENSMHEAEHDLTAIVYSVLFTEHDHVLFILSGSCQGRAYITIWINKNDNTHPSRASYGMHILSDIEKSEHKATLYLSLVHQNLIRYHWRLNPHCVIS